MVRRVTTAWTGYAFRPTGPAGIRGPAGHLERPIASLDPVCAPGRVRDQRRSLLCVCAISISPRPDADVVCCAGSPRDRSMVSAYGFFPHANNGGGRSSDFCELANRIGEWDARGHGDEYRGGASERA